MLAIVEQAMMSIYGVKITNRIAGVPSCVFGVIFHSKVALVKVHFAASIMAHTTQGQRAN
jgi:hypothetical protein